MEVKNCIIIISTVLALVMLFSSPLLFCQGNPRIIPNFTSEFELNDADTLRASTFIGGSYIDDAYEPSIVVGEDGSIFFSGYTSSIDFPSTPGAYREQPCKGSIDRFVCKFDSELKTLLASTFIGGTGDDFGMGLTLDEEGNIYIAGYTTSQDFPVTEDSYDRSHNGGMDVYVAKLDGNLTKLMSSTFLGGSGDEGFKFPRIDIKIGAKGNVYVAGLTKSKNFPIPGNTYDDSFNGGDEGGDAFIAKFDRDLKNLLAVTYIGGSMDEWRVSIVTDKDENLYICGETLSPDFATTERAYDKSFNGASDIFISLFAPDLKTMTVSTMFGGIKSEEALAMRIFNNEKIYICGYTFSSDFPTTDKAYSAEFGGGERDGYVAIFDKNLGELLACSFLGGSGQELCRDLVLDKQGKVFVTGNTLSEDFPMTKRAFDSSYNGGLPHGDVFVARLSSQLSSLPASTFLGGGDDDVGHCIDVDKMGNIYIGGFTDSKDYPTTASVFNKNYQGGTNDCFLTILGEQALKPPKQTFHPGIFSPDLESTPAARQCASKIISDEKQKSGGVLYE